jgi:hypothetical protein
MGPGSGTREVPATHGLWALEAEGDGWRVLHLDDWPGGFQSGVLELPEVPLVLRYAYADTASPVEKIAAELASALEAIDRRGAGDPRPSYQYLDSPDSGSRSVAFSENQRQYNKVAAALASPHHPAPEWILRRLTESKSLNLRLTGLRGLVNIGDPEAPAQVESIILEAGDHVGLLFALSDLASRFRNNSPGAVEAIGRIALNHDELPEAARMMAEGLCRLHGKESLSILIRLLDNPHASTRSLALRGVCCQMLSLRAHESGSTGPLTWGDRPGLQSYLSREQQAQCHQSGNIDDPVVESEMIEFWKSWWAAAQHQIQPQ